MFARDVRDGLSKPGQKELPCEYFYDEVGSALFEAITVLPEYGLTRADARLIRQLAPELEGYLRTPLAVAELGSGSGSKTRWILESLPRSGALTYYPIDISPAALAGKTIGVQSSTNHAAFLDDKYPRSTVRLYNTSADAYRDLAAGRIDYVLYDKLPAFDWLRSVDGACCEMAPGELSDPAYFGSGIGIALRKEDTGLLKRLDAAIEGIAADGTYAKINAKYFPFSIF